MGEFVQSDEDRGDQAPPYGYLLEGNVGPTVQCWMCGGSGFDSKEKNCACCCCYGAGRVFEGPDGKPVDGKTQREMIQHLRDQNLEEEQGAEGGELE